MCVMLVLSVRFCFFSFFSGELFIQPYFVSGGSDTDKGINGSHGDINNLVNMLLIMIIQTLVIIQVIKLTIMTIMVGII